MIFQFGFRMTNFFELIYELLKELNSIYFLHFTLCKPLITLIVYFKVAGKRDTAQEQEAQAWIETITGEPFRGNFEESLRDGILLCKLMNKLKPGIIQKINVSGGDYKMMDNISVRFFWINFRYF